MGLELNLGEDHVAQAHPVDPLVVQRDALIRDVVSQFRDRRLGSALVCENGVLEGIFTERDALRLMAKGADLNMPVADAMTSEPVTVSANDSIADAIKMMAHGGYRRLPIVDGDGRAVRDPESRRHFALPRRSTFPTSFTRSLPNRGSTPASAKAHDPTSANVAHTHLPAESFHFRHPLSDNTSTSLISPPRLKG